MIYRPCWQEPSQAGGNELTTSEGSPATLSGISEAERVTRLTTFGRRVMGTPEPRSVADDLAAQPPTLGTLASRGAARSTMTAIAETNAQQAT